LVFPFGVATPMFLTPVVTVLGMLMIAVIVVEFTTVKLLPAMVRPPVSPVSPVAPVKLVPTRVI